MSLADYIEEYIKKLLSLSARQWVDIQRSELAGKFDCVPSQINYVLSTRFTPERGYLVESRRGGKGYIRILRVKPLPGGTWEEILRGHDLDIRRACDLVKHFYDEKLISRREAYLMEAVLKDEVFRDLKISEEQRRKITRRLFYNMVLAILKESY